MYLDRDIRTDKVTLGRLYDDSGFSLYTLERPWLDNKPFISCYPCGTYIVKRSWLYHKSKKHPNGYECFEIMNIPDRTDCKCHIANYVHQVNGCTAYGLSRDENIPAVWSSGKAHEKFMDYMTGIDEFELIVRDV